MDLKSFSVIFYESDEHRSIFRWDNKLASFAKLRLSLVPSSTKSDRPLVNLSVLKLCAKNSKLKSSTGWGSGLSKPLFDSRTTPRCIESKTSRANKISKNLWLCSDCVSLLPFYRWSYCEDPRWRMRTVLKSEICWPSHSLHSVPHFDFWLSWLSLSTFDFDSTVFCLKPMREKRESQFYKICSKIFMPTVNARENPES